MKKIFVYGFPHSGTSILRKLIGNCSEVHDVPLEMVDLPKERILKDNVVIKATGSVLVRNFYDTIYGDYKIVIIIKNPYDVFGSLIKRFGRVDEPYHTIDDWITYAESFMSFRNDPKDNVFTVKYEELFENAFKKIEEMFEFLDLPYSKEEIIFSNRPAYIVDYHSSSNIPNDAPARSEHTMFRTWQINQKFTDKTGQSSKFLSDGIKEELGRLTITKKLGY